MNIGILASGGDGVGMNAFLYGFCFWLHIKNKITLFSQGYKGLIYDKIVPFDLNFLRKNKNKGGICIKTSRCPEFETGEGIDDAIKTLQKYSIDCLVVMGGNGSLKGLKEISDRGMDVMFVPCTIDNDLAGTDYCIGFDTACQNSIDFVKQVNDTMQSFNRTCIYQVMGRKCPQIAIKVAESVDADYVFTDEYCTKEKCLEALKQSTKDAPIVIVREDLLNVEELKQYIQEQLNTDVKISTIGYIQRGGKPTRKEKYFAKCFAKKCAWEIRRNRFNSAIIVKNNSFYAIDINKIWFNGVSLSDKFFAFKIIYLTFIKIKVCKLVAKVGLFMLKYNAKYLCCIFFAYNTVLLDKLDGG